MLQNDDDFALMPPAAAASTTLAPIQADILPWVEKYRPSDLSQVISQEEIVGTLDRLVAQGRLPHLLFYGPPGTGKNSISSFFLFRKNKYGLGFN